MAKTEIIILRKSIQPLAEVNDVSIEAPEGYVVVSGGYAFSLSEGVQATVLVDWVQQVRNPTKETKYRFACKVSGEIGVNDNVILNAVATKGSAAGLFFVDEDPPE